jgi:adenylate cyclase
MERRLAAILIADVVGYSRLMGLDEEGTLRWLGAHRRELIDPKLAEHAGWLVKTIGDGLLVEFASPVEATRCAVEIQRSMIDRNAEFPPGRRLEFRMGINLGDVIIEGNDVYGDGVNVAARLQTLAEPGGLCISGMVYDLVHERFSCSFQDGGQQSVKNIANPIRVYTLNQAAISALPVSELQKQSAVRKRGARWAAAATAIALVVAVGLWQLMSIRHSPGSVNSVGQSAAIKTAADSAPRLSIAVLPFANLSNDPQQDYFADGITDDLTTDLARIPETLVIARNSAFTYKGKVINAEQVGQELGVRYLLEGSVQRSEDQVRVNAQLIDAGTGSQLWADRFDYSLANLFELQNEITGRIARALDLELVDVESRRGLAERPDNPDAVDLAMRGWSLFNKPRARENNIEARQLFNQSLQKESQNIDSLLGLAVVNINDILNNWCDKPDEQRQHANELVNKALAINPNHAYAYFIKSSILADEKKPEESVAAAEMAISLNPNLAPVYGWIGNLEMRLGHADETITYVGKALRLSPRDPMLANWLSFTGRAQFYLGRDDEAIDALHRAAAANPTISGTHLHLAAAYALTGRAAEAQASLAEFEKLEPNTTISMIKSETETMSDNATFLNQRGRLYDGLRKAGMPE